jgi:hypothetical protein
MKTDRERLLFGELMSLAIDDKVGLRKTLDTGGIALNILLLAIEARIEAGNTAIRTAAL